MYIGRRRLPRKLIKFFDLSLRWCGVFLGAAVRVDQSNVNELLRPALKALQTGLYIPCVLMIAPLFVWLRRITDNSRLDDVHELLNQMRDRAFKDEVYELEQYRRVTLFKHRYFSLCPPFFGGFLVPIERSGTFTRKTSAVFRAPDDGEDCEGIAGRVWGKRRTLSVGSLPDLNQSPSDANVKLFAQQTFITEARARFYVNNGRKKKVAPRAIMGFPVEVSGKAWGVLVFDSTGETIQVRKATTAFNDHSRTLSGYLKGL